MLSEYVDRHRAYNIEEFGEVSLEGRPRAVKATMLPDKKSDEPDGPCELPADVPDWLRTLVETGDDAQRPRSQPNPRHPSRSESIFSVACGLARLGYDVRLIAGVLLNPSYGISESVREKPNPAEYAQRQARKAILRVGDSWPDGVDHKTKIPRRTFQNTQAALLRLGVAFWFDNFRQRMFVSGQPVQTFQGELNDRACLLLRDEVNKRFGFDPGKDTTRDAVEQLCNQHVIDPVCEYLDGLKWDGTSRIDTWLLDYAEAEDNPFVHAVGAITLIAAVRRARHPGTKFDTILVLEGEQGTGKSTLILVMASEEFFSDQDILALDTKAQMEALEGIWIFELCELAGIRHTDVNKVKAFASRAVDRARPAYGRFSESRPRRGILIGTTNDDQYLKDETGNRRFWPVRTGKIDIEGLAAARDQLWAEAAYREARGDSITLDPALWEFAQKEQEKRVEPDGWEIILSEIEGTVFNGRELATSRWLIETQLKMNPGQVQGYHYRRLSKAMKALGWQGPDTITFRNGHKAKGYWRTTTRPDDVESGPPEHAV